MEQIKLIELLTERIYTFITDPGHGWLKVPLIHLKHLNLLDKITPYSYYLVVDNCRDIAETMVAAGWEHIAEAIREVVK